MDGALPSDPPTLGAPAAPWRWVSAGVGLLALGIVAYLVSPKLGILALGLPGVPLLVLYPALGLLGLIALIPFDSVASLVPSNTLTLTSLAGMVVMGGWLVHLLVRRSRLRLSGPGLLLLAYVLFALLSLSWTADPERSLPQVKTLVQLLLLYVMAVNLLTTPQALERALDVLLVATTMVSLLVLVQYDPATAARGSLESGGKSTDPNYLAATLIAPAVAAVALGAARGRLGWLRFAAFGSLGLATVVTGSRGGLLAMLVGVGVVGILRPRLGVRLAIVTLLLLPVLPLVLPSAVLQRQIERFQGLGEDRGSGRLDIWKVGGAMARDNPILGAGFGSFGPSFYRYMYGGETVVDPRWARGNVWGGRASHNIYLSAAAELGAVGGGLLGLAFGAHALAVFRACRRAKARRDGTDRIYLALLAMFACFLLMGMTIDTMGTKAAWLLLALMQAVGVQPPTRPGPPFPQSLKWEAVPRCPTPIGES